MTQIIHKIYNIIIFMYVFISTSMQLRLYAKYYRSTDFMILPDGFEARVSSFQHNERFIDDNGVLLFFTFFVALPIVGCSILACYVIGMRKHLKNLLEKSDHFSSQAALLCVSQTYTIYVAIMDTLAVSSEGITDYMKGFIGSIVALEYLSFASIIFIFFLILCCEHSNQCDCLIKVKLWFVIVGLIPPLVCLSSHIGVIIEGWASLPNHGRAVMLFYSVSFIFLFISFKKLYLMLVALKALRKSETEQGYQPMGSKKSHGLDFCVILVEMVIGIVFVGVLVYFARGLILFPVLESADDAITYIYAFGSIGFLFVIFLLTYVVIYKTSGGIFSENVVKFWKYFYDHNSTNSSQNSIEDPCIESEADKVNALSAALLFHVLEWNNNTIEKKRYDKLLLNILGRKEDGDGGSGGGGGGGNGGGGGGGGGGGSGGNGGGGGGSGGGGGGGGGGNGGNGGGGGGGGGSGSGSGGDGGSGDSGTKIQGNTASSQV